MASLSSLPPPSSDSMNSRATDWGRNGERGSAFRGLNRGGRYTRGGERGRGGRGGGRGGGAGRGGRFGGAPIDTSFKAANSPAPPVSAGPPLATPSEPASTIRNGTSTLPALSPSNGDLPARTRAGSRRPSSARKVPSLTIEPASPTVDTHKVPSSATTSSSRSSGHRRRSHQHKPSVPKQSLSVQPAASQRATTRSGPPSPRPPSKDVPPHLSADPTVANFDMKSNIDSLVERVRAMAMDNRPTTPGSHIDWASDEDDTLPDLDDWGVPSSTTGSSATVPTSTSEVGRLELMSPILDDSLKQLPRPDERVKSPSIESERLSPNVLHGIMSIAEANSKGGRLSPAPRSPTSMSQQKKTSNGRSKPSPKKPSPRLPVHPSLPPKPVSTFESARPKSPGQNGLAVHHPTPTHGLFPHHILPPKPAVTSSSPPISAAPGEGSTDSILPRADVVEPTRQPEHQYMDRPGLEASIHAPKASIVEPPTSSSAPPEMQAHHAVAARAFSPPQGRSRTFGRPGAHRVSQSGSSTPS
ncbi:hypothetical protein EW146_g1138 [Bondarzewia mesenterica]|uniref:Uncharacterized protein n=1 Tax=Bondarzewia mesenterica TaxID=1095465 RepID=A0A4S4M719_9AGAM|nr:hypothetical protein EW146_g1138 [Bondarzewia mesenterica]